MEKASICEWTVTGMDCGSCAGKVRGAVERLNGVGDVQVTLMNERLRLTLDETVTSRETVESSVRALGYGIAPKGQEAPRKKAFVMPGEDHDDHDHDHDHAHHHDHDDGKTPWHQTGKGRLVLTSGALLVVAWAVHFTVPALSFYAFSAATVVALAPVARRAFAMLRARMPFTIEMLMTIAAIGALIIGEAEEAALVVFLFAVGELLEGVAANSARNGIRALGDLVPKTALLEDHGTLREVPAASLRIGQTVMVRPGDRIPADGRIIDGTSGIDESPVTGESIPVTKTEGADVYAGSINTEAALRIEVTKAAQDNTIARIIQMVEEAETARAPTERFIDRFSRYYMPAIVGIALLVAIVPPLAGGDWGTWVYRGLALLLIGCPCALVISVPASIASALSVGARRGLLMKGGAVVEAAATVRHVAFDKTGTLTAGKPVVTDIIGVTATQEEVLSLAASVEAASSHPLGAAIIAHAISARIPMGQATASKAIVGRGVQAEVAGMRVSVGSHRFAAENGHNGDGQAERLEAQGKTVMAVFLPDRLLGYIAVRDELRADAVDAVKALQTMGVTPVMLTGDNKATAAALAGQLGIEYRAELLPEDKVTAIKSLDAVMMVGDGINDAPALAAAQVGVAMGSGTDVALETAQAAILGNRVADVAAMIGLARKAMSNIRQNIAIALGLKAVFLVTTILGVTGLWIAIMADTGATVLVTLNALTLLRRG